MCPVKQGNTAYREKLEKELELLSAEASLKGMTVRSFCRFVTGSLVRCSLRKNQRISATDTDPV